MFDFNWLDLSTTPSYFELDDTNERLIKYTGNDSVVTVPNTVKFIGDGAFEGKTDIKKVVLPDSIITIAEEAFKNCKNLTEINLPKSLVDIGEEAFLGCESLLSIEIPDNIKTIKDNTFYSNESLMSVKLGKGVTSIGEKAFAWCTSLKEVDLPERLSSVDFASFGWSGLEKIVIPPSLETISGGAFINSDLKEIVVSEGCQWIEHRAFYSGDIMGERHIYLPSTIVSIGFSAFHVYSGKNIIHSPVVSNIIAFCQSVPDTEWELDFNNPKTMVEIVDNIRKKNGIDANAINDYKNTMRELKQEIVINTKEKEAAEQLIIQINQKINTITGFLKSMKINKQQKLLEEENNKINALKERIKNAENEIVKIEKTLVDADTFINNITKEQIAASAQELIQYRNETIKRCVCEYKEEMRKSKEYERLDIELTPDVINRINSAVQKAINHYEPTELPDFVSVPRIDVSDM